MTKARATRRIHAERELDPVWRALSNPLRRRILDLLREGPKSTGEIARKFPAYSRFAVMQHLAVLEEGGLLVHIRNGRTRMNYLNPAPIRQIYDRWVSRYEGPWIEALIALKEEAELAAGEEMRRGGKAA